MKTIFTDIITAIVLTAVVAIGIGLGTTYVVPTLQTQKVVNLGGAGEDNHFPDVTMTATSTNSYCNDCPVKLLDSDVGRRYARIENTGDTGETVYLYFSEDALALNLTEQASDTTSATGTITTLDGLIILTPTSSYEILPEKLFTGEIWASSTAATLAKINVIYR